MFLATTALSEFWDKDQEIFFLGSWCLRYDRRTEWEGLKYQVMPSPWDDRKRFYDATQYLDEFGERILNCLTEYLNSIHGVCHSQRYWRILIGPWLFHYLHSAYDRYIHLKQAFSLYPDLKTVVLDPRDFKVPRDTLEAVDLLGDDLFNFQIFSQHILELGSSFADLQVIRCSAELVKKDRKKSFQELMRRPFRLGVRLVGDTIARVRRKGGRVGLWDMYWSRSRVWSIAFQSKFLAIPRKCRSEWKFKFTSAVFDERRWGLGRLQSNNEYERIFIKSLSYSLPTLFLEGYKNARDETIKGGDFEDVIVSTVGWAYNDQFKFMAAEASEHGSRLVAVQHGGGYGIYRFIPFENHEFRVADSFMAWGWVGKAAAHSRNLPIPQLSCLIKNQAPRGRHNRSETILFLGTAHPRYLFRFHSSPVGSQFEEYFAWEIRFLNEVSDSLRASILFRTLPMDYGNSIRARIADQVPGIRWDHPRSFYQSLKRSRIVVIDHCSTGFLETLAANIPTILFWNPQRWEVRDEAEPYFESLRRVGILFDSPEAAAAKVAEVYDEPWLWWKSKNLQEVRKRFVDRYALSSHDWLDCWSKALKEEVS